eukprot:7536929-Pyramimonas_sp.AAC.1
MVRGFFVATCRPASSSNVSSLNTASPASRTALTRLPVRFAMMSSATTVSPTIGCATRSLSSGAKSSILSISVANPPPGKTAWPTWDSSPTHTPRANRRGERYRSICSFNCHSRKPVLTAASTRW